MLVLVATKELQGTAADDYSHTVEGELVTPVVAECCSPDRCGCAAGFPGLASSRATTTAIIADLAHLTEQDVRDVVEGALQRDGWFDFIDESDVHELIDEHVDAIAAVCATFPVGTVIGRRGSQVFRRSIAEAA